MPRTEGLYGQVKSAFRKTLSRTSDILPGYIKTDIVDGVDIGQLPFAIPVEQAAREMARLIGKRVTSGVVPAFRRRLVRPFLGHISERFTRV